MTTEQRELFRENLVKQLAAAGAIGLKLATLRLGAKCDGFAPADKEIVDALDYLIGKGLATTIDKAISPENARWKITSAGYDYAAANGLA